MFGTKRDELYHGATCMFYQHYFHAVTLSMFHCTFRLIDKISFFG